MGLWAYIQAFNIFNLIYASFSSFCRSSFAILLGFFFNKYALCPKLCFLFFVRYVTIYLTEIFLIVRHFIFKWLGQYSEHDLDTEDINVCFLYWFIQRIKKNIDISNFMTFKKIKLKGTIDYMFVVIIQPTQGCIFYGVPGTFWHSILFFNFKLTWLRRYKSII